MPFIPADATGLVRSPEEVVKLFPWTKTDLVRGIPHFISPAWATDKSRFDPEAYADAWKKMGFETVELLTVHHDGHYLYPSAEIATKPQRDFFGEQVKACRKRNIRVMAYYSLTLNNLVGSEHPEWRIRDVHGRNLTVDRKWMYFHWMCINSPFRDFARRQMSELADRYEIEGFWLDILYLPPHPPRLDLKLEQDTCFCEHCHRAYSAWYGGEHLLDAQGTPRHDEFRAESYRRFLIDLKSDFLKKKRPLCVTFNGAGKRRMPFYDRVDELADFETGEAHLTETRCTWSRLMGANGRPWEQMSCTELAWGGSTSKPTTYVKLEALATLLGGGTYTFGINHAPDGRLQRGNIERLQELGTWINARRDLFRDGEMMAEVGLLEAGQCNIANSPPFWRWVEFLRKGHFLFTIIRDFDPAKAPRAVVVPAGVGLSADLIARLESYVRQGGRLIFEAPVQSALEPLIGASLAGSAKEQAFYVQPSAPWLAEGLMPDEPVYFQCGTNASLLRCTTAKVVADLLPQLADNQRPTELSTLPNFPPRHDQGPWNPGIVIHSLGKGIVMTAAVPLSCEDKQLKQHPWPQRLVANMLRKLLGGQSVSIQGHEVVEVVAKRSADAITLHFLNHYYDANESISVEGECVQFADVKIEFGMSLPHFKSAAAVEPERAEVSLSAHDGAQTLTLSRLGLYQAVRLTVGQ